MKKAKKLLSYILIFTILFSTNITVFANDTSTIDNKTIMSTDNCIYIDGKSFTEEEFSAILNATTPEECLVSQNNQHSRTAVVAVYFVPGLGEVALLATGAIVIGATVYSVGTWAYKKFKKWLKTSAKKEAQDAAKDVSNKVKVKGSKDKVDLGQFKDKNGRTPKNKKSGNFTSTKDNRYTIKKDTAGHTGYDGTTKKWKLCLSGKRIASLNSSGKIIGN